VVGTPLGWSEGDAEGKGVGAKLGAADTVGAVLGINDCVGAGLDDG
jgi:hypothetical protein